MSEPAIAPAATYEADFYAWTQDQARRLREAATARSNLPLDFDNLAEEVESMGKSEARTVRSHLARVLEHLLKLEYSPAASPRRGWQQSVLAHRIDAEDELTDSPSLLSKLNLDRIYKLGRTYATNGLARDDIALSQLPPDCPYTLEQLLDFDWWPVSRHGLE